MRDYRGAVPVFRRVLPVAAVVVSCAVSLLAGRAGAESRYPEGLGAPVMSVSRNISLTPLEVSRVSAAARAAGAVAYPVRYAVFPMTAYARGEEVLMQQPKGWRVPMGTRVLTVDYVRITGGNEMADVLAAGQVLMGSASARIRGAQVGDTITLRDKANTPRRFTVGMIVANDFTDGEDLVMSMPDGFSMGVTKVARVNIVGFARSADVLAAMRKKGLDVGTEYRVRTSWSPKNPDETLGIASMKLLLGEFAFKPTNSAAIHIEDSWRSSRIAWFHKFYAIPIQFNCHKEVIDAFEGAFRDVEKAGLRDEIDINVSQRYGGCFTARYNRLGGLFGAPSRHAFGAAMDLNTTTNPQWGRPHMNCDVVRIFRKWGFAWGGNFWPADGMHFEWVGERRDQLGFPSRFCRNNVPVPKVSDPTTTTTSVPTTTTATTTVPPATTTVPTTTLSTTIPATTLEPTTSTAPAASTTVPAPATTSSTTP